MSKNTLIDVLERALPVLIVEKLIKLVGVQRIIHHKVYMLATI